MTLNADFLQISIRHADGEGLAPEMTTLNLIAYG
jgi:hypothetical protein